jgi:hypothetical protein
MEPAAPLLIPSWGVGFRISTHLIPNVQINYQSIGSGGGIQQVKSGTIDFGASDAPLSDEELTQMPAPVVQVPESAGPYVLLTTWKACRSHCNFLPMRSPVSF